jgi:hypothetical protein
MHRRDRDPHPQSPGDARKQKCPARDRASRSVEDQLRLLALPGQPAQFRLVEFAILSFLCLEIR